MASQNPADPRAGGGSEPESAGDSGPESGPRGDDSGARGLASEPVELAIGAGVRLAGRPRYLKTADPMPMLRPPDLVDADELGTVVERRALDLLAVRFRRGTFLIQAADLEAAPLND